MAFKTARQKIQLLLWLIIGVGTLGILFTFTVLFTLDSLATNIIGIGMAFVFIYIVQMTSAIGLALHWFTHWVIRSGNIIKIIKWTLGIGSAFAMLDLARRFLGESALPVPSWVALSVDGITMLLFTLWLFLSYFIHRDVKERKVCEFC